MSRPWRGGIAVLLVFAAMTLQPSMGSAAPVRGPVIRDDFPDPAVVRDGSTYYLFATNTFATGNVPVARSSDLTTWQVVGDAMPTMPTWASPGFTWAPAVTKIDTTWVLYFTANHTTSGRQCIGRAVSSSPTGPYVDNSAAPLVCQLDHGGSIDPSIYFGQNGNRWLIWKSDDNAIGGASHLWSRKLAPDGLSLTGAAFDLLVADQAWEFPLIEGPAMVLTNRGLLLFYAGGWWESTTAAIGYAACAAPSGPCQKVTTDGPWMSTDNSGLAGPQGASFAMTPYGTVVLAFAGWINAVGYSNGGVRAPFVEPVDFSASTPVWRPDRPRDGPLEVSHRWLLRDSASPGRWSHDLYYGLASYAPTTGDWNGDGTTDIGVFVNGTWYLRDSLTPGPPNHTINYGTTGYTPVTGDWNGDGTTDIGVYVNGTWYLRDSLTPGPPDHVISYGTAGYTPVTGDWNGDGTTDIGVFVNGTWCLRDSLTPGPPNRTINYGTTGYTPVTGDWNGDGTTDIGVFVNGTWYLRDSLTPGPPNRTINYGAPGYTPVPGDWNGDHATDVGVTYVV